MADSGLVRCQNCGTLNDPNNSMTGIPACVSCGLTSVEGAFSMQDELSKLFERGLTFSQPQLPSASRHADAATPSPEVRPVLGYSASQHYIPVTRPVLTPEPDVDEDGLRQLPLACEQILRQHGIDPANLQSQQRSLFLYATPDQRERLLELWTTYQTERSAVYSAPDEVTTMDHDASYTRLTSSTAVLQNQGHESAEPYIQAGYGIMQPDPASSRAGRFSPLGSAVGNSNLDARSEYRQSVDPAFQQNASQQWWRHDIPESGHHHQQKTPQEFQYDMFEAFRQYHIPIDSDEML